MVTMDNYEEYMILFADGELNADEQQQLLAFVKAHPELEAELKAYASTKLTPDESLGFGDKAALLQISTKSKVKSQKPKDERKGITINLRQWAVYSAAAGIAAILITMMVKWNGQQQQTTIAHTQPIKKEQPIDTIIKEKATTPTVVVSHKDIVEKPENKNLKKVVTKPEPTRYTNKEEKKQVMEPAPQPEQKEEIVKMDIAPMNGIKDKKNNQDKINIIEVEEVATTTTATKKTFIERLPIDEEKKEGIKDLTNTLTSSVQQVKNITNNLKETAFVVKVGNRQLKLNF